jgi:hypothetical protein
MKSRPLVILLLLLVVTGSQRLSAQVPLPPQVTVPEQSDWDHEIAIADDTCNAGNFAEAEPHYRKSLEVVEHLHLGDVRRATRLASIALALGYQKNGEADPRLLKNMQILIGLLRQLNRSVEAAEYEARQREILNHQTAINSTRSQSK